MKHPYTVDCPCKRCTKELARRQLQATSSSRTPQYRRSAHHYGNGPVRERRPVHGSQEWAETRADDIPSLDQPGDDFDMP